MLRLYLARWTNTRDGWACRYCKKLCCQQYVTYYRIQTVWMTAIPAIVVAQPWHSKLHLDCEDPWVSRENANALLEGDPVCAACLRCMQTFIVVPR